MTNACWDLWAKTRKLPLWQLLLSLSPEELLATLDLSYLDDVLTRADAVALLAGAAEGRDEREKTVREGGVPGYVFELLFQNLFEVFLQVQTYFTVG